MRARPLRARKPIIASYLPSWWVIDGVVSSALSLPGNEMLLGGDDRDGSLPEVAPFHRDLQLDAMEMNWDVNWG